MKISSKFSLALLAGTILSTPAMAAAAATLTPTLDTIKAEAADISGSYELTGPIILPTLENYSEGRVIATIKLIADNRDYLNRVSDKYREIFASIIPENVVLVEIDNKLYYFTPSDNDAERLRTLAGTVAGNLKEDENGIFEFDGKKYSFNTEAIPESVFEYTEGTAEDYNFTMQEADAEGNITTKYYKIVLKPETFATSENIKWSTTEPTAGDITGSVELKLPNNQTQTFYYSYEHSGFLENSSKITWETTAAVETPGMTDSDLSDDNQVKGVVKIDLPNNKSEYYEYTYTKPEGYTDATDRIDDTLSSANVTSVVFKGISSSSDGGAIYNTQNHGDIDIIADFIGNDANGRASGGAIYNRGTIGDITGDFIGNYIDYYNGNGGAIYNSANVVIGNITGDFIGNYVQGKSEVFGGAISNSGGTIGSITGDFIGNYVQGESEVFGGAIDNRGTIGDITGDFIGNYVQGKSEEVRGGAIYNSGSIGDITGDFIGNHISGSGGVIYNVGSIGNIAGNFIGNYMKTESGVVAGGIIVNGGGNLIGDSIGSEYSSYYHRPLPNTAGTITGEFFGNYIESTGGSAVGGVIYNATDSDYLSVVNQVTGNFTGNHISVVDGYAYGGAVYNDAQSSSDTSELSDITLLHLNLRYNDQEIEIYLPMGEPTDGNIKMASGTLTVSSEEEFLSYKQLSLYTHLLEVDPANFGAEDYVDLMIQSGAFQEEQRDEILAEFEAQSPEEQEKALTKFREMAETMQNMVNNAMLVTDITTTFTGGMTFYNSSFRNNYVKSENGEAKGGAIYGNGVTITADNYTSIIDGNKANDESNAFYVQNKLGNVSSGIFPVGDLTLDITSSTADLTLTTVNNGVILLNDGIDGVSGYSLAFNGDKGVDEADTAGGLSLFNSAGDGRTTQYVKLNNSIANAGNINIANTTLSFGEGPYGRGEITADGDPITKVSLQNAAFDLYNGYTETVNLKGWSTSNSYLHIDVDVAAGTADVLNIAGDVVGQTKVIVYADSEEVTDKSILFATATGYGTEDSFTVYRVYNSPYMFDVDYNPDGENGKEWSLTMNEEKENENAGILPDPIGTPEVPDVEVPDVDVPDVDIPDIDIPDIDIPTAPVYGEVVAYGALPAAALEQTRNMVDNVGGQVAATRTQDAAANYNLWVNPTYYTSNIDSPFAIDADIWGIEAGGDIQRDIHNRLGIFFSYRQGEYDMSGNGDRYYSTVGSEIDIDSYIAGLYYRYDHNNWYAFATLYGGIQEADIKTDDGMKTDTDGVEFGASAEAGYDYALTDSVTLTPELGVFYTQVNYDDATDSVGKSASYDNARQIELEAGVKLAKTFMTDESFANVYVKPSVVQTIIDGDEVSITGLGDVETLDDATLGRIEIGGRYGFTTNLSAYGWANYTFGSDYDATTFGLGLNYAF